MGHYDKEFEDEVEEKHRKMKRKRDIENMQRMDEALTTINYFVHNELKKDAELLNAWDLIQGRYALWQIRNNLLVKDPNIIIEVLQDDK